MANQLHFGDNLDVLRNNIRDESVDLIYLDPPFNSKANYNVLFKEVKGTPSTAQIEAFTDTWKWDATAARTYQELIASGDAPVELLELLQGFDSFLKTSNMMAYLVMMAPRLVELHRVLKSTGSLYLHCDPTASHYLKLLLDAVFGKNNFQNEIIWAYKSGGATKRRFARKHDVIFFYTKDNKKYLFNTQKEKSYNRDLKPYNFEGVDEYQDEIGWYTEVNMKDVWNIDMVGRTSKERLGYPTQKPQALLERILKASSNEGDVVLDPFCGCGTTIAAAQALNRRWIGVDITYLAINLIKSRLADHFGDEIEYELRGIPKDWESARELAVATDKPRKEFELWALSLVKASPKGDPSKKGGGDKGIDGVRFFLDKIKGKNGKVKTASQKIIVQVKSDQKPKPSYVRDLRGVVEREKAVIGALILLHRPGKRSEIYKEAASAGFYHSELYQRDYPMIQVFCIEDLLEGTARLEFPEAAVIDTRAVAPKIDKNGADEQIDI